MDKLTNMLFSTTNTTHSICQETLSSKNLSNINKNASYIYKFERVRLGNKTRTKYGAPYGKYLYRDTIDGILIASCEKPTKEPNYLYCGSDIGTNSDALEYYKNT